MHIKSFAVCSIAATWLAVSSVGLNAQPDTAGPPPPPLPPPGKLIDLGGYKLHINCTGSGSPTVVLSVGAGDFSTDWALVQPKVASFTRVCSYDRSGAAWSDLGPKPRTLYQEVFDLERLLRAAGERTPSIMVGQSLGGMVARVFAQKYRRETAGVVLVDAYSEDAQLTINGKLTRLRLLAGKRLIPAPRSTTAPSDAMTAEQVKRARDFIKQFIGTLKSSRPSTSCHRMRSAPGFGRWFNRKRWPKAMITSPKFPRLRTPRRSGIRIRLATFR